MGSSLILTRTYYAECRFVLPGHFGVFIKIQHTEAKNARTIPRLHRDQSKDSSKLKQNKKIYIVMMSLLCFEAKVSIVQQK